MAAMWPWSTSSTSKAACPRSTTWISTPAVAAASGPPLTPKADHDVAVLVTNLLGGNRRTPNYDGLASAVFTIPPLASAGLTEEAARAAERKFRTHREDTSGWFHTRRVGETTSGFKVLIEEGTDHIWAHTCWARTPTR
jgi:glutathione reductase (NADPH)